MLQATYNNCKCPEYRRIGMRCGDKMIVMQDEMEDEDEVGRSSQSLGIEEKQSQRANKSHDSRKDH